MAEKGMGDPTFVKEYLAFRQGLPDAKIVPGEDERLSHNWTDRLARIIVRDICGDPTF